MRNAQKFFFKRTYREKTTKYGFLPIFFNYPNYPVTGFFSRPSHTRFRDEIKLTAKTPVEFFYLLIIW
jgi:hypothetical protein